MRYCSLVDFDALDQTGQLLPARYLAHNVDGNYLSTDVPLSPRSCPLDPREPAMVSITTWTRLEPRARGEDPIPALEARVYELAWLRARVPKCSRMPSEGNDALGRPTSRGTPGAPHPAVPGPMSSWYTRQAAAPGRIGRSR